VNRDFCLNGFTVVVAAGSSQAEQSAYDIAAEFQETAAGEQNQRESM